MASQNANDAEITHPDWYTRGGIDVYDFIEAKELNFAEGNVVKYVVRAPHKGQRLSDLKKAREYINKLIAKEEAFLSSTSLSLFTEDI